mgnify:FL=1
MINYAKTFLILFIGLPVMLLGKTLVLTTEKTTYELEGYLETLREEGLTITEARQAAIDGRFAPIATGTPIVPFQDYWIRIEIDNQYTYTEGYIEWMLQFSRTWSQVEVYFEDLDHTLKLRKSGLFTPVSDRIFKAALRENVVKFNLAEAQQSTLYIRLRSDRVDVPPSLSIQLSPAEVFLKELKQKRQQNSFFVGFVWMMTLLSILFFFQTWSKVYVFYSMYLIGVSTYASYVEGDLPDYLINLLFPEHPQYIFFVKLIVYLAMVGYLLFLRSFLNLKEMLPRWDRIFNFTIWMSLPLLLLDAFLMMQYNFSSIIPDRVTLSFGIYFAIFNLLFLRSLYFTKDRRAYFVIVGICAMSAGIILMVIARLQSPEFSVAHLELGIIIEILAFTLGLAYRQRVNERERFKAHYELEKSQFIQQQKQAETQRLRELDELKNRLYTNITHEFRTPLTVIMGMANEVQDERVKKLINRNSENLLRLINQILDLSKLESGKMSLHLVQGDIIAYLQYLTESFLSAAEAKQIRLSFYPEEPSLMMDFDEEKIQLIVYNLLSNAIKFTPNGGKIIFHGRVQEEGAEKVLQLKVQDSGPGIPAADLPYIFDRFYQVDNPNVTNQGGTGIGLALTKQLIELMGGEIEVSSEEGQGSLFSFFLPVTNNEEKLEENWKPLKTMEEPQMDRSSIMDASISLMDDRPMLLIIEDNADVIEYIERLLQKDYLVKSVRNGEDGIQEALRLIPDIIISDIMMPGKNGYEVCDYLKNNSRTSHIPIILLTAKTAKEEQVKGLRFGADAFLTKPFHKEELLVRLQKLIELRKKLQAHFLQDEKGEATPSKEEAFLATLKKCIAEQLDNSDLSVNDLCRAVQLSHAHLYRKLKALTNLTPVQFIRYIRLKEAKKLLERSSMNISEIAYAVGFSDPNYFSRIYHKEMGITPTESRK